MQIELIIAMLYNLQMICKSSQTEIVLIVVEKILINRSHSLFENVYLYQEKSFYRDGQIYIA